ncbi:urea amidolyase family protein [Pseudorhodoferax sp. Leaf267]|uniref:5-oxoprolinase subunit B/C family protein n=1 Tax=Pseudorhodoferax sp. Leaf267 TaxID=1736316 RepID=UPI0006F2719F|nr:urea amidolyase family protein [Pseudorhodoferax sp. Leaf267]KQP18347.1 allophanate hydrolase [Pseudorhodoferax sp. Leaf267]
MRFLPVNLDALLVELDDLPQTLALLASLQAEPIAGVDELVPAARTILVRYRPHTVARAALVRAIAARRLDGPVERNATLVEIPVHYDGEDLDEVAGLLGATREQVIGWHSGSDYTVAFVGFAPGFAYLSGGDPRLDVPRRATPRTRVPAGAVALAGRFSAVYPQDSPGGWQLIGVTDEPMWDLAREVPALLQPGARVRFVDAGARRPRRSPAPAQAEPAAITGPALQVLQPGPQSLLQDLGRAGQAGQGVSASGAMDRGALRAANRLVGNAVDAACIEAALGGLQLRSRGEHVVAVTGAAGPLTLTSADGRSWPVPRHAPLALADGDVLLLGAPQAGLRSYVAVRGGFDVPPVLASRSTDMLARLGPPPLAAGTVLPVGPAVGVVGMPDTAPASLPTLDATVTLDVVLGPRTDWCTPEAVALLATQDWTVTTQSNRVGLRLAGERPITRANTAELPSEGVVRGAIQVPPSGQPVLFLADHPLTGGYPVVGAVAPHHLDLAGQIPLGARIRFHPIRSFEVIAP